MDPNACMTRIMNAVKRTDKEACVYAIQDLLGWLRSGGFSPFFSQEMAGYSKNGPRRCLTFRLNDMETVHIQTVNLADDSEGWELRYFYNHGSKEAWKLEVK